MKIHTLLGLPVLAFALAAPAVYAAGEAGGNTPRTGTTDDGTSKPGRTIQRATPKNTYPGQNSAMANNATQSGKKTYDDRSGGVGTGAGSSENLGSSNPGGGVNSSGSGSGKP
ncbi:MAG TPA: hypothetical protein VH105_07420 [Burkholderiales bacterium]|nr:hypothetical protein [Burkholderiales bacterium]